MLVTERAYAKLNLTLGVLYKRADGYHAIDSLMQTVDVYDSLNIEKARDVQVTVSGVPLPAENTLTKAAALYKQETGCGCHVHLIKRLPLEAGLGGGSADAAALLRGLQKLHRMADERTLYSIALQVGADVPFCLRGGTQRAEGVGEILTPIHRGLPLYFVLAKPTEGVSTRALFGALGLPRRRVATLRALEAVGKGDLKMLAGLVDNVLEDPAVALLPEIGVLKNNLLEAGALAASMTGSGSTVFGLFASEQDAANALPAVEGAAWRAICQAI